MLRHLTLRDYVNMPWKNGLGETMQLFISPPNATVADLNFDWRLSIAKVGQEGPFSLFPGYDRHIMVIEGAGMDLHIDQSNGSEETIQIGEQYQSVYFSGDLKVRNTLIGGPIRDFNLIVRRDWAASSLVVQKVDANESFTLSQDTDEELVGFVCLSSSSSLVVKAAVQTVELAPLDCCFLQQQDAKQKYLGKVELTITSSSAPSIVAIIRLKPLRSGTLQ